MPVCKFRDVERNPSKNPTYSGGRSPQGPSRDTCRSLDAISRWIPSGKDPGASHHTEAEEICGHIWQQRASAQGSSSHATVPCGQTWVKVLPDHKNLNVRGGKDLKDQSSLPHMLTSSIFPSDFNLFQVPRLLPTPRGRSLHSLGAFSAGWRAPSSLQHYKVPPGILQLDYCKLRACKFCHWSPWMLKSSENNSFSAKSWATCSRNAFTALGNLNPFRQ